MTKILLVEDDKSLREIYGVRLLAEGYDIVSAGDGEEALAMAIKERPQLIVSDVMMPKISGFDMLDILRSTTETKNIKVIMMTALSSDDQRERGEQLGADRYLVKSQVGIEDVVRTVHEVLGDAPVAGSVFGQAQPAQPQTQQQYAQPTAPQSASPQNTAAPQPAPQPQPQPVQQTPQPATHFPPQPTAPFASPRPATLGERVIHPIENTRQEQSGEDLAARIASELNSFQESTPNASSSIPVQQVDHTTPANPSSPPAAIVQPSVDQQSVEPVFTAQQPEQTSATPALQTSDEEPQAPQPYPTSPPQA